MCFSWRFITLFLIMSFLLAACNMPGNTPTAGSGLQVTQTMQAVATEVRQTLVAAGSVNSAQPTTTPMSSETSIPAESPTPEQTATPTISAPSAHVNTNTNCRSGPSTVFDQLYVALAGEDLKVVSRTTISDYVLVENPKKPGQTCWLWTQYVDLSGDLSVLPVASPPPTPTPVIDFKLGFSESNACSIAASFELEMENTGEVAFKSASMIIQDKDTNQSEKATTNSFNLSNSCVRTQPVSELAPGKTAYVYASVSSYDPTGHHMAAKVTLCTEQDMMGTCVTKEIKFTL
jgi:predicted small secreted protein